MPDDNQLCCAQMGPIQGTKCKKCRRVFGNGSECIRCETCRDCFHLDCISMSIDAFKVLSSVPGVYYRCPKDRHDTISDVSCVLAAISDLDNKIQESISNHFQKNIKPTFADVTRSNTHKLLIKSNNIENSANCLEIIKEQEVVTEGHLYNVRLRYICLKSQYLTRAFSALAVGTGKLPCKSMIPPFKFLFLLV